MSRTQSNEPIRYIYAMWPYGAHIGTSKHPDRREALLEVLRRHYGDDDYVVAEAEEDEQCDYVVRDLGDVDNLTGCRYTVRTRGEQ